MISDQDLMTLHVEALFTHDATLRLRGINEPWATQSDYRPAPRFFLGRTGAGNIWRFRADLPLPLVEQLADLCATEPVTASLGERPKYFDAYLNLLEAHHPIRRVWQGPAYYLVAPQASVSGPWVPITAANAEMLGAGFEKIRSEVDTAQPFFGIVEDGRVVSICRSVRISPSGHEAGVETLPDCRRQGYATAAITRWAIAVSEMGCLPLYSTAWENRASQSVAGTLGAVRYGIDFHVT